MAEEKRSGGEDMKGVQTATVLDDPAAPSADVSSKRQSLSDVFTIVSCPMSVLGLDFSWLSVVSRRKEARKGKGQYAEWSLFCVGVVLRRIRVDQRWVSE